MLRRTIICILFFLVAVFFFIPHKKPEFSFTSAVSSIATQHNLHTLSSEEEQEIKKALSSQFVYSGCGAQVYVFFSEDGNSVIKLLKKKRFEVPLWIRLLPPNPYKARKMASKQAKVIREFSSYQIAFDQLQEETGLLLVHLGRRIDQKVTFIDSEQKSCEVNLGDYAFILQRKGELVYPSIEKLVRAADLPRAKEALFSLLHLLKQRCNKGVSDTDPNFEKNFAFIEGKALQVDIGRFSNSAPKTPQISKNFKAWLHNLSPELYAEFESTYNLLFINSFAESSSEKDSNYKPKSEQRKS